MFVDFTHSTWWYTYSMVWQFPIEINMIEWRHADVSGSTSHSCPESSSSSDSSNAGAIAGTTIAIIVVVVICVIVCCCIMGRAKEGGIVHPGDGNFMLISSYWTQPYIKRILFVMRKKTTLHATEQFLRISLS